MDIHDDKTFKQLQEIWGLLQKRKAKKRTRQDIAKGRPHNLGIDIDSIIRHEIEKVSPYEVRKDQDMNRFFGSVIFPMLDQYIEELDRVYTGVGDEEMDALVVEYRNKVEGIKETLKRIINSEEPTVEDAREAIRMIDIMVSVVQRVIKLLDYDIDPDITTDPTRTHMGIEP